MELSSFKQKFILHWGEMGTRWGINRTVAQIHALLYISENALHAEEISKTLSVARSNVSTSLRELQGWGIAKVVHVLGDRRDHFETMTDVWEMFRVILGERKRREIDPTLEVLRECVAETRPQTDDEKYSLAAITEMLSFMETLDSLYLHLKSLPTKKLISIARFSAKIQKALGLGK